MNLRKCAVDVLIEVDQGSNFAREGLNALFEKNEFSQKDRAFLKELVYGCIRRRATLDWITKHITMSKNITGGSGILNLLRVGLYQLSYMDRVPDHAAVHETVEAAKKIFPQDRVNFVNAVLRQWIRKHKQMPLPDRKSEADHFMAISYSYPETIVKRWIQQYGVKQAEELFKMGNEIPRMVCRVNESKTSCDECLKMLTEAGIKATVSTFHKDAVILEDKNPVSDIEAFREGFLQVQDEQAINVVDALAPSQGENIADICAAPGGKTCHIAQELGGSGSVFALDVSPEKTALISENVQRLGLTNVHLFQGDGRKLAGVFPINPVDKVLIDAPCSNTGVLRRRIEARWRFSPQKLQELTALQLELLEEASTILKPGGTLLYSTCSIEKEENEELVAQFLKKHSDYTLSEEKTNLPQSNGPDGGYWAKLVKK